MENLSALEVTSRYVAALAAKDVEAMNAFRVPGFALDFVYGYASESGPLSSEETKQFWPSWLSGFPEMDYEVTRTIATVGLLVIPIVTTALTMVMLVAAVIAWIRGYWSTLGRLYYSLITLTALAFVWWASYWNLIGYRL